MVAKTTTSKKIKATMSVNAKKLKQQSKTTTSAMENLLGPNLLTSKDKTIPTKAALKGKELVALYFGASWYVG